MTFCISSACDSLLRYCEIYTTKKDWCECMLANYHTECNENRILEILIFIFLVLICICVPCAIVHRKDETPPPYDDATKPPEEETYV